MGYPSEDHEVIDRLQREIGRTNRDKGFREDWELADKLEAYAVSLVSRAEDPITVDFGEMPADLHRAAKALRINILGMKIALIHSEASEMLSDLRDSGNDVLLAPEGIDVIIRTLDLLDMHGEPAGPELVTKMRENKDRPYKHGRQA
jgi:hypothetical protein